MVLPPIAAWWPCLIPPLAAALPGFAFTDAGSLPLPLRLSVSMAVSPRALLAGRAGEEHLQRAPLPGVLNQGPSTGCTPDSAPHPASSPRPPLSHHDPVFLGVGVPAGSLAGMWAPPLSIHIGTDTRTCRSWELTGGGGAEEEDVEFPAVVSARRSDPAEPP